MFNNEFVNKVQWRLKKDSSIIIIIIKQLVTQYMSVKNKLTNCSTTSHLDNLTVCDGDLNEHVYTDSEQVTWSGGEFHRVYKERTVYMAACMHYNVSLVCVCVCVCVCVTSPMGSPC